MATHEQANEYLGGLAADVDESLSKVAPAYTFALTFWLRGEPDNAKAMAIMTPPVAQAEQRIALLRAASVSKPATGPELHGLDTAERVCFYEQDFYVLSNFSAFTLEWEGLRFDTLEAAYHWEKFRAYSFVPARTEVQEAIRLAPSAHEAFKIAQEQAFRRVPDWDRVKVDTMKCLLMAKVYQHEYVRRKLLATGERELVENSWRDDFWGWGPNRDGQNMLGKLWMEVRAEIRAAEAPHG